MKAYTDYPFVELGDIPHTKAPIRECEVLSWDGDKYAKIICDGKRLEVKVGYLYNKLGRLCAASFFNLNKLEVDCDIAMSTRMNKKAYQELIRQDIDWLLYKTDRTLERDHIVDVLKASVDLQYPVKAHKDSI